MIGKPSASSIAAANTAADGMTPASPAPLMPSGFSGDGVSRWSISIRRHLRRVGHQEVHERGVEQLAVLVVGHPLVERAADALRDAAVHLALDDHRVDQRPAVVHDAVAQHVDLGGLRVGLDDRRVHAVGERRPRRRVVVGALQARLLVRRRPAACSGRPTANWVAALAASSNAYRSGLDSTATVASGIDAAGMPLTRTSPSTISRSPGSASSASPAIRSALARTLRAASATALPHITAAREANVPTAYPNRRVSPVVTSTSSNGTPSSSATICANNV